MHRIAIPAPARVVHTEVCRIARTLRERARDTQRTKLRFLDCDEAFWVLQLGEPRLLRKVGRRIATIPYRSFKVEHSALLLAPWQENGLCIGSWSFAKRLLGKA